MRGQAGRESTLLQSYMDSQRAQQDPNKTKAGAGGKAGAPPVVGSTTQQVGKGGDQYIARQPLDDQAAAARAAATGVYQGGNPIIGQNQAGGMLTGAAGSAGLRETGAMNSGFGEGWDDQDPETGDLLESWLRNQLGGPRDTSAEEAALQEQMQHELGQGLVDMRARMGRAGFGASGALGAMELDARSQAARDAAEGTFDLRERARAEELARAQAAMQGYLGMSGLESQDAHREAMLKIMAEMYGPEGGGEAYDGPTDPQTGEPIEEQTTQAGWMGTGSVPGLSPSEVAGAKPMPSGAQPLPGQTYVTTVRSPYGITVHFYRDQNGNVYSYQD